MSDSWMCFRRSFLTVATLSRVYSGQPRCAIFQVDSTSPYEVVLVESRRWAILGNHGHRSPDVGYFRIMDSLGNGMNWNASFSTQYLTFNDSSTTRITSISNQSLLCFVS